MQSSRKAFLTGLALILGGLALFFLFLFFVGHDPDERPLSFGEWMLAGALIGPGVGYLVNWKRSQFR